jgi:hypothetical protein
MDRHEEVARVRREASGITPAGGVADRKPVHAPYDEAREAESRGGTPSTLLETWPRRPKRSEIEATQCSGFAWAFVVLR